MIATAVCQSLKDHERSHMVAELEPPQRHPQQDGADHAGDHIPDKRRHGERRVALWGCARDWCGAGRQPKDDGGEHDDRDDAKPDQVGTASFRQAPDLHEDQPEHDQCLD